MDKATRKPTAKKTPPSEKAMRLKKDAARAKAAADPFAAPGSARATLTAHRNKVKTDKSKKSKEYKEASAAWFHGTNAHYRHTTIEGRGVGKVGAVFTVGMNRADIDGVRDDEGDKYEFTTRNGSHTKATALWQTDGSDGVGSKIEPSIRRRETALRDENVFFRHTKAPVHRQFGLSYGQCVLVTFCIV